MTTTVYLDQAAFGPFTSIASAATTDLSTVISNGVNITGTTTITSFGTGTNLFRIIVFAGALTLTHNATSLKLPNNGSNITTVAGDRCIALSDGSGNWTVVAYQRTSGGVVATNLVLGGTLTTAGGANAFSTEAMVRGDGGSGTSGFFGSNNASYAWGSTGDYTLPDTYIRRAGVAKVVSVEGSSSTGGTFRHIATSPAQITADQNNYAPGGTSKFQRWNTDAARNITGMSLSQVDGQEHTIVNVGSFNIVLVNQSASSTASNRFLNSTGADITLAGDQSADVIYDNTTKRWRVFKRN